MATMSPAPGERMLRYVGDRLRFVLRTELPEGKAYLRTNLGREQAIREEIIQEYRLELLERSEGTFQPGEAPFVPGSSWRDLPMTHSDDLWEIELSATEPGFFQAKAYFVDENGRQVWPHGPNAGISIHPSEYRSGNTLYCAFARMFGETKSALSTVAKVDPALERLDKLGYTVIPPSGKLRDVIRALPHIFERLGCRILQLLPVNPTPTTFARFGRFGSPYATEDLTAIDPALVEFDRRTTGVEQFEELCHAVHARGGKLFLDIVVNHTGWGSTLQERHPDWFLRTASGNFASPGAWGTTWEDLVELDHRYPFCWDYFAEVFLTWCRRGVDGFRCDAGYKVPTRAWRYITARVREEFPDTLFLLEGLGGAWEATEDLLTFGGMQWAYSELFQNHTGLQVSGYLDHSIHQSERAGTLLHYSETHDNERLAQKGRPWSLMRNQLCALASHSGGFAFTAGVEWLARERLNVHSSRGMAWGNPDNLLPELERLNRILAEHPCFFDGAKLVRLSGAESKVYVLERVSAEGLDRVLILVNLDPEKGNSVLLEKQVYQRLGQPGFDLLTDAEAKQPRIGQQAVEFALAPGEALCLAATKESRGLSGQGYRKLRASHALAIQCLSKVLGPEEIGPHRWKELAGFLEAGLEEFLSALSTIDRARARADLLPAIVEARTRHPFPNVITWSRIDQRRVTCVPHRHWVVVRENAPFRAVLHTSNQDEHVQSVSLAEAHVAVFAFNPNRHGIATLQIESYAEKTGDASAELLFLTTQAAFDENLSLPLAPRTPHPGAPAVLLTNGRGGMARMCVDLGAIKSKYDCVLGANLHPGFPVDRHIFVKRLRAWANIDHFISPLSGETLHQFQAGPPAKWRFKVTAGNGRTVEIGLRADMIEELNATVFEFMLLGGIDPEIRRTRLTIRLDIEDRNFHSETLRNGGADFHFSSNTRAFNGQAGFEFLPANDRRVRVYASSGHYHPAPEWSHQLPHTVERTRGQVGAGDAYSPGWFDVPLEPGVPVYLIASAEESEVAPERLFKFADHRQTLNSLATRRAELEDTFGQQLAVAAQAYVVKRGDLSSGHTAKTIIAGYPWFLDWGRDSLICARGLIAAGMIDEVKELVITFGRFEQGGTLPNTIHGADASNRDTSDAPLWYGVVAQDLDAKLGSAIYDLEIQSGGRKIRDVLRSIALGYINGTSNGIRMDDASGLVWSPSHFTWMDTNHPAGTPREGYPVEIQALWIRLLWQLAKMDPTSKTPAWVELAELAQESLRRLFWVEEKGWIADCLHGPKGTSAMAAKQDDALRSNCVIPITFGLFDGEPARACLQAVAKYLVVPGALRSLAPLRVEHPLPIHGPDWRLLNHPHEPYWGRYEGDEDTQRKPAYHNGTAWTWTFPGFCEALAKAWNFEPQALSAAKAYLGSMQFLLKQGCIGQIPEILDGDVPHNPRGCDAQAWGVTEALRVWKLLNGATQSSAHPPSAA